jgi:hypothetical protein
VGVPTGAPRRLFAGSRGDRRPLAPGDFAEGMFAVAGEKEIVGGDRAGLPGGVELFLDRDIGIAADWSIVSRAASRPCLAARRRRQAPGR